MAPLLLWGFVCSAPRLCATRLRLAPSAGAPEHERAFVEWLDANDVRTAALAVAFDGGGARGVRATAPVAAGAELVSAPLAATLHALSLIHI